MVAASLAPEVALMHIRGQVGWVVCLIPGLAAMALMGPGMVSRADGCSGMVGQLSPGWNSLALQDDASMPSNGVILLRGTLKDLAADAALSAVTAAVKDDAGALVAGALSLEDLGPTTSSSQLGGRDVLLVFKPDAPFAPNTTYAVSWAVDPATLAHPYLNAAGQGTVTTAASAVDAGAPSGFGASFSRTRRLGGEQVTCSTGSSVGCGPTTLVFGSTETQAPALGVGFTFQKASASSYQLVRIEPVAGKGTLSEEPPVFSYLPPNGTPERGATVLFADDVSEYCVNLVTTDLSDGSESSETVCAQRTDIEAPGDSLLVQTLAGCVSPPNTALTPAWCESHATATDCAAGAGNASGSSGGCAFSGPAPHGRWLGLAAIGVGLSVLRRRRQVGRH